MKTYLVKWRWRYKVSSWDEDKKNNTNYILWNIYHSLFSEEKIVNTDLKGEALYSFIYESIKKSGGDEENMEYFLDNLISLD